MSPPSDPAIPQIYHHPDPKATICSLLRSHLPYSIPLYRRIQQDLKLQSSTSYTLASFAPEENGARLEQPQDNQQPQPWLVAWIDLHRGPETQGWVYSSIEHQIQKINLESPGSSTDEHSSTQDTPSHASEFSDPADAIVRAQLLALFAYIREEMLPAFLQARCGGSSLPTTTAKSAQKIQNPSQITPHPPTSILLGTLHVHLLRLIQEAAAAQHATIALGRYDDPPYLKYLFRPSTYATGDEDLPLDFTFTDPTTGLEGVQKTHTDLIISRTHIPRTPSTLLRMVSAAIFHTSQVMPVAWGFLGLDGSLCTLHVEPQFRGRGLARFVARRAMRMGMGRGGVFGESEPQCRAPTHGEATKRSDSDGEDGSDAWAHADVAMDNTSSRRVMEKLGAELRWENSWVVIELRPSG